PCNLGRSSGMTEEPRLILKKACMNFVEMYPNRADNYCCSGGGGAMSMSEYTGRRLEVAKVKADQLKETGAKVVATACHNCIDAIQDLIKHYKLGMKQYVVSEIVENALVWEKKAAPPKAEKHATLGKGKKILVVDDEEDVVTFLTTMFEDNGFTVCSTTDSTQAMDMVAKEKPDLISLDVVMPELSGTKLYKMLREHPEFSDIPIYIVSGVDLFRKFIYERPIKKPEGFIDKPIDKELIISSIRKTLAL
ncbi:response regulator, partial [Fibrobacterota bacterium]